MANYVAVGGDPEAASLIDNFIWPAPDEPSLGDLDRAVDACVDVMHALRLPFISGKDSLSSTYRFPDGTQLKIPPVLCVSVFGKIDDVAQTTSADFKEEGSTLVVVGARDTAGMGGSTYADALGLSGGHPPHVDLELLPATLKAVHGAIRAGELRSCHDLSEGGLLTAIAESCFGGGLGADIDVESLGARPDFALLNETAGCFVVEMAPGVDYTECFSGVPAVEIGSTIAARELRVMHSGAPLFSISLGELRSAWERPMREVFH
jgi:phosphoribosylformylglycinamidine synthase